MSSSTRPLALVTGASSGIGADLARELARDGHDLVLAARTVAPMENLAAELTAHGAGTLVIPADLSQPGAAAVLLSAIESRGLTVDVLVNNAGVGAVGRFDQVDPPRIGEMLQVNIVALSELTRLLLPGMVARRHGKVMLVASTATNFAHAAGTSELKFFNSAARQVMSAAAVARIGYRGLKAGRRVVITGTLNRILATAGKLAPHAISLTTANALMSRR